MWFSGGIRNALAKAKNEKRLLIIYVSGVDEISDRVSSYWENDQVQNMVNENPCVALKLSHGTEAATQFGQIYPVLAVPISFFIMPNGGVPLEVLVQYDSLDAFKEKLKETIEAFKKSESLPKTAGSSPSTPEQGTSSNRSPMSSEPSKAVGEVLENQESPSNLQDRVEKAKQLMKERQDQKSKEAEENARLAEIKRREEGRNVQRTQEQLKEAEALKIAEERKKAKKDDKEYLNKLREQIAADRAEKAAKFNNVQAEQKKVVEGKKQEKVEMDERQRQEEEERRKRFALLQFRLPDGSAIRNQFNGSATFAEAEQWLAQEIRSATSSFLLVQMLPRREFTAADRPRSLADLGLTPNAVLMVLPNATGGKTYSGPQEARQGTGWIGWIWQLVTSPVRIVLNFLYVFAFGSGNAQRPVTAPPTNASNPAGLDQQPGTSKGTGTGGTGNITQFRNAQDNDKKKDDDNATWNGNSTQQL